MIVSCHNCGKNFQTYPSRIADGRGKFCSKNCSFKNLSVRRQGKTFAELYGSQSEQIKQNISKAKTKLSLPSKDRLYELYWKDSLSMAKIAEIFRCSTNTIFRWMTQYKMKKRNKRKCWMKEEINFLADTYLNHVKEEIISGLPNHTWSGIRSKATRVGLLRDPHIYREQRPTVPEIKLLKLIKEHGLPFRYTGDWSFVIGGFNPDFIANDGSKKIIEVFGRVFHDPEKSFFTIHPCRMERNRKVIYEKLGYQTLILWDDELDCTVEVLSAIQRFVHG